MSLSSPETRQRSRKTVSASEDPSTWSEVCAIFKKRDADQGEDLFGQTKTNHRRKATWLDELAVWADMFPKQYETFCALVKLGIIREQCVIKIKKLPFDHVGRYLLSKGGLFRALLEMHQKGANAQEIYDVVECDHDEHVIGLLSRREHIKCLLSMNAKREAEDKTSFF